MKKNLAEKNRYQNSKTSRIATRYNLERISGSWGSIDGVQNIPKTIRPWIYWLVAVIKCGYTEIRAPIWSITKSAFKSTSKTTCSRSSTFRALKFLEDHGYISRSKLRIGNDIHGVVLKINKNRFEFFLRKKQKSKTIVVKYDEMYENRLQVSNCDRDKLTSNNKYLTSNNINSTTGLNNTNTINKININKKNKRWEYDPLIFSLLVVSTGMPKRKQGELIRRAKSELDLVKKNKNSVSFGCDWEYWRLKWSEFSLQMREYHAKHSLLPYLLSKHDKIYDNSDVEDEKISIDDFIATFFNKTVTKCDIKQQDIFASSQTLNDKKYNNFNEFSEYDKKIMIESQNRLIWQRKNLNIG